MLSDLFWSLNFLEATILKCDVVALQCQTPTHSLLLFLSRVETGSTTQTHVIFQDGGSQESQWSKQIAWRELYTENDQNWAADVDTSWGKLLFEIDIVGQPRFPLRQKWFTVVWRKYVLLLKGFAKTHKQCIQGYKNKKYTS